MVGLNQIQRGFTAYIDNEVSPKLSGLQRLMVSGGGGVLAARLPALLQAPSAKSMLGAVSLTDENGNVDIDVLYAEFKRALQQSGSITIDIPMPFQPPLTMKINDADLDNLYQYIIQQR